MRVIHVLASQIWFGAVVCILGYSVLCFNNRDAGEFLILVKLIPELYKTVVLPFAMLCVIQGILYGIFSKWGFFKFRWITLKWIMVILVIVCTGMGGIGQIFSIIAAVEQGGIRELTFYDGRIFFAFSVLQIFFLSSMTVLSVLKPRNF
jgi:hypothetical protein